MSSSPSFSLLLKTLVWGTRPTDFQLKVYRVFGVVLLVTTIL